MGAQLLLELLVVIDLAIESQNAMALTAEERLVGGGVDVQMRSRVCASVMRADR